MRLVSLPKLCCTTAEDSNEETKRCAPHTQPRCICKPNVDLKVSANPMLHTPRFPWTYRFLYFGSPKKVIHSTHHLEHETLPLGGAMISQVDAHVSFMSFNQVEHGLLKFSVCTNWNGVNPYKKYMALCFSFPFSRNRQG